MNKLKLLRILLLCLFLCACTAEKQDVASTTGVEVNTQSRWPDISAQLAEKNENSSVSIPVPGSDRSLSYSGLKDVRVRINGELISLEEAVAEGHITPEQIVYFCRMDALGGICKEEQLTENGLTHFLYTYDGYTVVSVHDVFQTPAKGDRLISGVWLCDPASAKESVYNGSYTDEEGFSLQTEDWGLSFEVMEVDAAGFTLRITQSGGQHNGQLCIMAQEVAPCAWDEELPWREWLKTIPADPSTTNAYQRQRILNGEVTQLRLDWGLGEVALPSGSYRLVLHIFDDFDPGQVHPLTADYTDTQKYILGQIVVP